MGSLTFVSFKNERGPARLAYVRLAAPPPLFVKSNFTAVVANNSSSQITIF